MVPMFFESYKSILYSDTLLPDIFISEYLPSMSGECVKVYLYCLFLSKYNKQVSTEELSKKLEIEINKVKDALTYLESVGIITRKEDNSVILMDLKEKEMNKHFRPKLTSTPEEAIQSSDRNRKRNAIVTAINNSFFQGLMPPSWYTDIDAWFDKYQFEEDVMYALFQHCYDHKALTKPYLMRVADSWHTKCIVNSFDLDKYFVEYQKLKDIKLSIVKKLKLNRMLTEYEQDYIEKWVMEYLYSFEIIDLALKQTTKRTNPNFEYIHAIITDWYKNGLKTIEEIMTYSANKKQTAARKPKAKESAVPQHSNFKQRDYDDEFYDNLYENA